MDWQMKAALYHIKKQALSSFDIIEDTGCKLTRPFQALFAFRQIAQDVRHPGMQVTCDNSAHGFCQGDR
jgi:hypothetical protein